MDRRCGTCDWYEPFCAVCCNGYSEHRKNVTGPDDVCPEWAAKKEKKQEGAP